MLDCDKNMALRYVIPPKNRGTSTTGDVISLPHKDQ